MIARIVAGVILGAVILACSVGMLVAVIATLSRMFPGAV